MLDIKFIRENAELVKKNIKKKFQEDKIILVDKVIEKEQKYKELLKKSEDIRHKRNQVSMDINRLKKDGKPVKALLKYAKEIPEKIKEIEEKTNKLRQEIKEILYQIPNIIHESVPIGKSDKENVEIEKIGKTKKFKFEIKSHAEIAEELGLVDFESSANTSGKGFYFLKGDLALLNMALINFARDYMVKQGYLYIEPPLMIRENVLTGVYSKAEIDEMSYKIEGEDLFLIATSEHPLIGQYIGKTLDIGNLPIKLTGYSMCFRKEVGAHGVDERGLYRTHQFNKQEMIVICKPEESYKFYDEMLGHSKKIFKQLEIPIRVFECCFGDLADLKTKSADLEAWSPRRNEYFEVCSCSNLTDAQSRRLNLKVSDGKEKFFPHTLNNTVIATSRALVAILENNQNEDGSVDIPKVLVPYMNGVKKLEKK
ncbi:MAG: serine--tRNA ligase [Candidatus Woesearchaeota archaeon]